MATAFATTGGPGGESTMTTMGGVGMDRNGSRRRHLSIPEPIRIEAPAADDQSPYSISTPSPRSRLPPPNPPFVFPARHSVSSAPSSLSRASGQRPKSVVGLSSEQMSTGSLGASSARPRRSPALPAFSFNPGASLTGDDADNDSAQKPLPLPEFSFNPGASIDSSFALMSPPRSPASPHLAPNRGSHRRGGSEFVGGKLREGDTITVMNNTSPTRSENGFASPALQPVDSSARRGRHAHRRSAAISSHDLSMILKPPTSPLPSRGNSAPNSPADFDNKMKSPFAGPEEPLPKESPLPEAITEPSVEAPETPVEANHSAESSPSSKPARAKVGFSDTLEYIPRPLSMVSTDTSSTITGHPGHSVSNSISSIISLGNSTIADRERPSVLSPSLPVKQGEHRPSTAGPVLERTPSLLTSFPFDDTQSSPRRRNSIPLLPIITMDEPSSPAPSSPTKIPKRWSFFGLDPFASSSPGKQRPLSSSSFEMGPKTIDRSGAESELSFEEESEAISPTKKPSGKKKKQKKVKSWAGSLLPRKTKSRSGKSKSDSPRAPTPPPSSEQLNAAMYEDGLDIAGPFTAPMVMVTQPANSSLRAPSPDKPRRKSEDDASYPMIDLDAALGPFNTPSARDPAWDAAQRKGAPPKRQLHSAAGMRGFSGPGMHYHRRAESAPEMPPFEGKFGIHRFGSSSTMADVFEEEEEDESEDSGSDTPSQASTPGASTMSGAQFEAQSTSDGSTTTPTQEVDYARKGSTGSIPPAPSIKRKGSGSSLELPAGSRVRTETSISSLHDEVIAEEVPVQHTAVDQERIYEPYHESDSVAPSPRRVFPGKDLAPVEIHPISLPGPMAGMSPYSMSHSSSFPSPRSPMSCDAHRVSTAPSSVTEETNFQSLLMGEPGPEVVRISVDVPSLTDSTSTMTRESNFPGVLPGPQSNFPGVRPRNRPFHEQRPASFTASAFGRRRSSLASLSRLISTSHGERSKLSMEVPLDEPEKKTKVSIAKRLSRMVNFRRPKESPAS